MNVKGILKIGLLTAMLASFFISNGITGSEGSGNCGGSGNNCSDNGCNGSDGQGGMWCCTSGGDTKCQCLDTTSSSCP